MQALQRKTIASTCQVLLVAIGLAFGPGPQVEPRGPAGFRALKLDEPFPTLGLVDLEGKESVLETSSGKTRLLAFVRLGQTDSMQLFKALEAVALDATGSQPEIVVIGMHGRDGWRKHAKGLPRRMRLLLDGGATGEQLGIIVLPSLAILDGEGQLKGTHVLYDEGLIEAVRREVDFIENGASAEVSEEESLRQQFATMKRNAASLEAVEQWADALVIRKELVELQLEPAQMHSDLARTQFMLGEMKLAIGNFTTSLELEDTTATRVWLGRALARTGADEDALRLLKGALPLTPQKAVVHRELADIYKRQSKIDLALEHLKAAIDAHRTSRSGGIGE